MFDVVVNISNLNNNNYVSYNLFYFQALTKQTRQKYILNSQDTMSV